MTAPLSDERLAAACQGPAFDDENKCGWHAFATSHIIFGGSGHISPAEARRFAAALLTLADGLMPDRPERRTDLLDEDSIRADERRRCAEELRSHSKARMDLAVAEVAAGNDGALTGVSFAATLDKASRLLESGELSASLAGSPVVTASEVERLRTRLARAENVMRRAITEVEHDEVVHLLHRYLSDPAVAGSPS